MSTLTQVIDAKWFGQGKNGDLFDQNLLDFSRNILGSVFKKVKLQATIKTFTSVTVNSWYLTTNSISTSSGTDLSNGISVGDICRFVLSTDDTKIFTFEVTSVSPTIIYFNQISNVGFTLPESEESTDAHIIVESDLTFLRYNHGLRSSIDPSPFYRSYLDDQTLSFVTDGIGSRALPLDPRDTNFIDGLKIAINGHSGSFKARYVQNSQIPKQGYGSFNSAQEYEIEHIFTIQDYSFNDVQNYINLTKPSNYLGESTLDYNSEFEFRTVETNPDTSKKDSYVSSGAIGFLNENLNGGVNKFSVSGLSIERLSTGEIIENLSALEPCKVSFTINSTGNSFLNPPVIVLNHFAMISDYEQKNVEFDSLFRNDLLRVSGVGSENGTYITQGEIISFTSSSIDVEMTVNPSSSDLDGLDYLLSVWVGNPDDDNILTDEVQLKISTGVYSDQFDIDGLITSPDIKLYTRDCDTSLDPGFTSMELISGELINTKFNFSVFDGEISSIALQTISFGGGVNYVVDSIDIDTSNFQLVSGVQRIDETLTNPYNLGLGGYIKWVSNKDYEIVYPYRLPFDKLNAVSGLSDLLYDPTEPNNGQNESVYYQQIKGFDISIAYLVTMIKDGRETEYLFKTPVINVVDFETSL